MWGGRLIRLNSARKSPLAIGRWFPGGYQNIWGTDRIADLFFSLLLTLTVQCLLQTPFPSHSVLHFPHSNLFPTAIVSLLTDWRGQELNMVGMREEEGLMPRGIYRSPVILWGGCEQRGYMVPGERPMGGRAWGLAEDPTGKVYLCKMASDKEGSG